jgi:hypothetical protein
MRRATFSNVGASSRDSEFILDALWGLDRRCRPKVAERESTVSHSRETSARFSLIWPSGIPCSEDFIRCSDSERVHNQTR